MAFAHEGPQSAADTATVEDGQLPHGPEGESRTANVCTGLIEYLSTIQFSGSGVRGQFTLGRRGTLTTAGENVYVGNDECGDWEVSGGSWTVTTHLLSPDEFQIRMSLTGTRCGPQEATLRGECNGTTTVTAWFSSSFASGNVTVTRNSGSAHSFTSFDIHCVKEICQEHCNRDGGCASAREEALRRGCIDQELYDVLTERSNIAICDYERQPSPLLEGWCKCY
ncbi:hypothetical protein BE11_02990 [Sorangium cellulosum]|nr:hypothetical protein BE11_02990 [Sorangium cellulosum]